MDAVNTPTSLISGTARAAFASFWSKNMEEIIKVRDSALVEYCKQNSFTKQEFDAFSAGLATFPNFIMMCDMERQVQKKG